MLEKLHRQKNNYINYLSIMTAYALKNKWFHFKNLLHILVKILKLFTGKVAQTDNNYINCVKNIYQL